MRVLGGAVEGVIGRGVIMSKARILSAPRAGIVELTADLFSDVLNMQPTFFHSPIVGGWLVAPLSDPRRVLVCSYADSVMFTWEGGEAEPVEVPPAERLETARWALAQAWQFERYYSGSLAARMSERSAIAVMRYNLTLAYLSAWFGARVAAPHIEGPPRAYKLASEPPTRHRGGEPLGDVGDVGAVGQGGEVMSRARILSAPRAGIVELTADLFSDVLNMQPTFFHSPIVGGWLVAPLSDPRRVLVCSYADSVMFTWEGGEAEPVEVPPAERLETARWALAQAWQFERYYSGSLAARMSERSAIAVMRYNLTLAYLSAWFGARVAAPPPVGQPIAYELVGAWNG